jgi:hypothetical protein
MYVVLGAPQVPNEILCGIGRILTTVLINPVSIVIPPFSPGEEVVRAAINKIGSFEFPDFLKPQALAVGLCVLSTHLCSAVIDLPVLLAHFLAFDEKCLQVGAQLESDTILSFLIEIVEHHMIPQ